MAHQAVDPLAQGIAVLFDELAIEKSKACGQVSNTGDDEEGMTTEHSLKNQTPTSHT